MREQEFLGQSKVAVEVRKQAFFAAHADVTVLLLGETGTGKELLAHFIHQKSDRSAQPFVVINCPAITETLGPSELFGHERGAYTGASQRTPGSIQSAENGIAFFDEVADLPERLQLALLRCLGAEENDREVSVVGRGQAISVNVRVIASTNQHFPDLIAQHKFRSDLYHRLSVFCIVIPPLRERKEDIPLLVTSRLGHYKMDITPDALDLLCAYEWPGNVRQLRNVLCSARTFAEMRAEPHVLTTISKEDIRLPKTEGERDFDLRTEMPIPMGFSLQKAIADSEKYWIAKALKQTNNNVSQAADLLGINRGVLRNRIRDHFLNTPALLDEAPERPIARAVGGGGH